MPFVMQRFAVGVLAVWLVLLSGLVYPQLVAHVLQHAHHNASAHGTALCSWLCIAADAIEGAPVDLAPVWQSGFLACRLLSTQVEKLLSQRPPSRAPPSA